MTEPDVFRFSDPASLEWTDAAGALHTFSFDLVEQEEWKGDATVTKYPVEKGANISDHVRVENPTCTLTIFATNEPIESNAWASASPMTPMSVTIPTPTWTPSPGLVSYQVWNDDISLRSLAASLLGGLAGGLTKSLGGFSSGVAGVVGAAAGMLIPGDVAENAAALQGNAIGAYAVDAAASLVPGFASPTVVNTSAGLTPPTPAPPVIAQTLAWPNATNGGQDFVGATIALLTALKNSAQLISVLGSKETEDDMVITSIAHTRNKDTGSGASITLTLEKVRIVATNVVAAPVPSDSLPGANASSNKGTQNPSEASTEQQKKSVALAIVEGVARQFGGGS